MEIWRDIEEYLGIYQVSNLGRVRRWRKKKKEWFYLKPLKHSGGYQRLKLRNSGYDKDVYIHRLVAEAFLNDWDESLEVNHIDRDKTNNSVNNLEVCNRHENVAHSFKSVQGKTSVYNGVYKPKDSRWNARIMVDGVRYNIGYFDTEKQAHLSYLGYAQQLGIKNKYA